MTKSPVRRCRTECWFDALTLETRQDMRFRGAFLSAEKHPQFWRCNIRIGIVDTATGVVQEVAKAWAAPKQKISLHLLAKTVMAEAQTLCKDGDVIRYVKVHAVKV